MGKPFAHSLNVQNYIAKRITQSYHSVTHTDAQMYRKAYCFTTIRFLSVEKQMETHYKMR